MVTSVDKKIQIAHLMRRAGFGSNYDQIQELSKLQQGMLIRNGLGD